MSLYDRIAGGLTEGETLDAFREIVLKKGGGWPEAQETIKKSASGPFKVYDRKTRKMLSVSHADIDWPKSLAKKAGVKKGAAATGAAKIKSASAGRGRPSHRRWRGGASGDVD